MSELIPTSVVPHLKYPYESFNPAQSLVVPWRDKDVNLVCASPTGSGKTEMAELVMDDAIRNGKKAIYAAPMKAIIQEKKLKWASAGHGFEKLKIVEVSGDVKITKEHAEEIQESDIIVMTTEALDARCRRIETDKNAWLSKVGVLVVDEVHLLTFEERGDRLESALMRFSEHNKTGRLAFLSGTVSNYEQLGKWATLLNGKKTAVVSSDFRPCPLRKEFAVYDEPDDRFLMLRQLMNDYPKDRFIIFVATKPEGNKLLKQLRKIGLNVEFHSADRNMESREKIESDFKTGKLDHLVATSTLAYGVNLPARRVVIYGVTRGRDPVHAMDIHQECGRAGRMGYDPAGDAYIFVKREDFEKHRLRLEQPSHVESRMSLPKAMAFHLISQIDNGGSANMGDIERWFSRSLSTFQGRKIGPEILKPTLNELVVAKVIEVNGSLYRCLPAGRVSAWFYHSPFDVAAWRDNFTAIFKSALVAGKDPDDFDLAWAFSTTRTTIERGWLPSGVTRERSDNFQALCMKRRYFYDAKTAQKICMVVDYIAGEKIDEATESRLYEVKKDAYRIAETLRTLGEMSGLFTSWKPYWRAFAKRLGSGLSKDMLPLSEIEGVGRERARELLSGGIRTPKDVVNNPDVVKSRFGDSLSDKILKSAAEIVNAQKERMEAMHE